VSPEKIWKLKPASTLALPLAREAGLSTLQAQLLVNRGITSSSKAHDFLNPRLNHMADPWALKGMDQGVAAIIEAMQSQGKITIYGDYDADGLTATALLVNFLRELGIHASAYIPNRLEEGYGLNREAISRMARQGTDLIITVDCGISNPEEVALAQAMGMEVVITDHHQVPEGIDMNAPVVNPHQPGCLFPFKDLAGVGVAFFLAVAIRARLRKEGWFENRPEPDLKGYLDLVALGTVADRVPLVEQNRLLVTMGMGVLAGSRWEGLSALKQVAGIAPGKITAEDVAFKLVPRLNACGRMGRADVALQVLAAEEPGIAQEMAWRTDAANRQRQAEELSVLDQVERAIGEVGDLSNARTLVMGEPGWHRGVLGIVASRLVDKYRLPTLLLAVRDGMAVGSGRSTEGFNLYEALVPMSHLFEKFGGHAHAVGVTLAADHVPVLRSELDQAARKIQGDEDLVPSLHIEAEVSLPEVSYPFINEIQTLAPFGQGNPEPLFLARSLEVVGAGVVGDRHLKLRLRQEERYVDAIGFGISHRQPEVGAVVDMVVTPELNQWQGLNQIQLKIWDIADSRDVGPFNP
jgi:single-stranded-DNA-specific exonuclease